MDNKKEWFGEWFDSKYYHILYKHRDKEEAQKFIDSLCQRLQLNHNSLIMDLACGKGRHAIYLNNKGYQVTGLDLSNENIDHARKFQNDRLRFYKHDMRKVWSENEFDCVLNLFTSFGYFNSENENEQVIHAVASSLKKGGKFVLDFLNPYTVINRLLTEEIKMINGIEFHINKEVSDGYILKNITFNDEGKDYFFQEKVRTIRRVKFLEYFDNADLRVLNIMGDYDLNNYVAEKSDRMIFFLEK